jgi:diguanylate cyclase (GGDEF)-like protein
MEKYRTVDLNIFLILILFMIIHMIGKKQSYRSYSTRLFLGLCWSTIILLALDVVFWLVNGVNSQLIYVTTIAYFLAEPLPLIIWLCYLDFHVHNSRERLRKRWYYTQPLIFIAVLLLISTFTNFIFSIDSAGQYQRGPGIPLILGMNFTVILATIFITVKQRKSIEKKDFPVIVLFGIIPIFGGILQTLTYGVAILWNSVAMSVIFIYIFLETQKEIRDYLTGLLNRQQIDELILTRILDVDKKGGFSLIMLDMDDFKLINDKYGHTEGDRALIRLSEILQDTVKKIDRVARFGGDEFIILLEEDRTEKILEVIDRIRESMKNENSVNERPYDLSVSIGYSIYSQNENKNLQELLHSVDQKMYLDKSRKRN